jgi:translation elongation factor P/translation initiation factor 5A
MKKQAKDVKKGETILLAGKSCAVLEMEISDIGKHGKSKVRLELLTPENEKIVIIRPAEYPVEVAG